MCQPSALLCLLWQKLRTVGRLEHANLVKEHAPQAHNTSGAKTDKFATFGLTPRAAGLVKAPLINECYANLECKVIDTQMTAKYCLFIIEVIKAWIDPSVKHPRTIHHLGKGTFMVAGTTIKLPSKMR